MSGSRLCPGTKTREPDVEKADPYEAVPGEIIAE